MKLSNIEICRTAQHNLDHQQEPDEHEPAEEEEQIQCKLLGGVCTGCRQCKKMRGNTL